MDKAQMEATLPLAPADLSVAGVGVWLAAIAYKTATARNLSSIELATMLAALLAQHVVSTNLSADVTMQRLAQFIAEIRAAERGPRVQ